jgi:TusE/DsrC/DsvC family sulfur relay protein
MENTEQSTVEKFDCQGFFADKDFWSVEGAENLAKANDIGEYKLSDDHWKVIQFVREYYEKNGRGPAIIKVVKHTRLTLSDICKLFPCGLVKGAYRLAGLPRPPGCV